MELTIWVNKGIDKQSRSDISLLLMFKFTRISSIGSFDLNYGMAPQFTTII